MLRRNVPKNQGQNETHQTHELRLEPCREQRARYERDLILLHVIVKL